MKEETGDKQVLDSSPSHQQPIDQTNNHTNLSDLGVNKVVSKPLDPREELIQREIIDKKYEKDLFFDFCSTRKTYGDDLRNWKGLELQGVVNEFVKYQEEKRAIEAEKNRIYQAEQLRNEQIQKNINEIRMNAEANKVYSQEGTCKKLDKTQLNDKKIISIVRQPLTNETGFFESNYVNYEVYTKEFEWGVRRRYSDFEWLRTVLVIFYPRKFIPPLPSKKIGSRRFEPDFIEKRMNFLQKFLNSILESETLKANESVVSFLSIYDRTQFEYKMKELKSIIPSQYVEDIKTLSGKLSIIDDENNEKYYVNINNYFKLQNQLLERLNYNLKQYYFNIGAACMSGDNIQKDFETGNLLNSRVLMKEEVTKSYEEFGIFFKNWKRIQFNQNEVIKARVKDFFKFVKMEGCAYEELINSREEIRLVYQSENTKGLNKKEKGWTGMDISKWELADDFGSVDTMALTRDKIYAFAKMCSKDTQRVESIHRKGGYANHNNIEELKKMIHKNSIKFIGNIKAFVEELSPTGNDSGTVWTELSAFVS